MKLAKLLLLAIVIFSALPSFASAESISLSPVSTYGSGIRGTDRVLVLNDGDATTGVSISYLSYYNLRLPERINITGIMCKASTHLWTMFSVDTNFNVETGARVAVTCNGTIQPISRPGVRMIAFGNDQKGTMAAYEFIVYGDYVIPDTTPPTTPKNVQVNGNKTQVAISWSNNTETDLAGYNLYINGTKANATPLVTPSYSHTATPNTNYSYQVTALDSTGNESAKSEAVSYYWDSRPSPPTITGATASVGKVVLTWTPGVNNDAANVYLDGTKITATPITGTSYTATGVSSNVEHTWEVTGVSAPYESARSAPVTSYWDNVPPGKVTGLFATPGPNQITLEWIASKAADRVTGYYLYRDGSRVTPEKINGTKYVVSGVPGVENTFEVTAVKVNGLESDKSDSVTATALEPPDLTPPDKPTGLRATGKEGYVQLVWNANAESDLDGYYVYRSGIRLNTIPMKTTNFNVIGGMSFGIGYRFEVSAVDKSGNESAKSDPATAAATKPTDVTPPAVPSGLTGSVSSDALKILLSWNSNHEDDLAGYNLYASMDGIDYQKVNAAPLTVTNYAYPGIQGNTLYHFKLSALDVNGNESKQTPEMSIKTPSRETNPDVEPTAPKLIINWQPIVGAVQYLIYYNDALYAVVGSNVTSYEITLADGYDPDAERQKVAVKGKFLDGSIGQDPPGGADTSKKWGFSAVDIFKNSMWLVSSVAGFVLLGIIVRYAPRIIRIIKQAVSNRRKGEGQA